MPPEEGFHLNRQFQHYFRHRVPEGLTTPPGNRPPDPATAILTQEVEGNTVVSESPTIRTEFISDMCLLPIGCDRHGTGITILVEFRRIWQEL